MQLKSTYSKQREKKSPVQADQANAEEKEKRKKNRVLTRPNITVVFYNKKKQKTKKQER